MEIFADIILRQIPSAQKFLDTVFDELIHRRSLVVLLPSEINSTPIWTILRERLLRRDFHIEEMWLPDFSGSSLPILAISEALNIDWSSDIASLTTSNFLAIEYLPDILQLSGFEELSEKDRNKWINFLKQWAEANHTRANHGHLPISLILITQAENFSDDNIQSNLYLAVHNWLKIPSALETHLVCRLMESDQFHSAKSQWREYLLPALAGNNLLLIEYLWDSIYASIEVILEYLEQFAIKQGWRPNDLHSWGVQEFASSSNNYKKITNLPVRWYTMWAKGILIWTPEYGLELHPAALIVLGKKEEVLHRVWRGQADLLLPLIDHSRLILCDYLTRSYGRDWPIRWNRPESDEEYQAVKESPLASQWGYLEWLVKNCRQLRREKSWIPFVSLTRQLRNEIAHYRPVNYTDFDRFWQERERIEALVNS